MATEHHTRDLWPGGLAVHPRLTYSRFTMLSMYPSKEDAIELANATSYGLAAFVFFGDLEHDRKIAE